LESSRILHSDIARDDWLENISFSPNCECPVPWDEAFVPAATVQCPEFKGGAVLVAFLAVASAGIAIVVIVVVAAALLEFCFVFFGLKVFALECRALDGIGL